MAYSDGTKVAALTRLASTGYDFSQVANETGVSETTLRRWINGENGAKKDVAELLENALSFLLSHVPKHMDGRSWGVAVGILIDKWLLMGGQPTARTEIINIDERTRNELADVLREADRILDAAADPSRREAVPQA